MDWSERIRQRGEAISQLLYEREIALIPDPVIPLPPITRPLLADLTHPSSADEHSPRDGRAGDEQPTRENSAGARHPSHGKKKRGKRYFHAPLPDARSEYLAQRVTNWTKSRDAKHALSLPNARRLVEIFGYPAVDTALENASSRRQKLTNPAGFIVIATRGNYVEFYQRPAPRYEVERRRTRRAQRQPRDGRTEFMWEILRWFVLLNDPAYLAWRGTFFAELGIADHLVDDHRFDEELPF